MVGFHRKVCLGKKGGWKPSKPLLCKGDDSIELAMVDQVPNLTVFDGIFNVLNEFHLQIFWHTKNTPLSAENLIVSY